MEKTKNIIHTNTNLKNGNMVLLISDKLISTQKVLPDIKMDILITS